MAGTETTLSQLDAKPSNSRQILRVQRRNMTASPM
jgi:hypothetical protein